MKSFLLKTLSFCLLCFFANGCVFDSVNFMRRRNEGHPPPPKKENVADANYRVRKGDQIGITCLEDSLASVQAPINQEGEIDVFQLNRLKVEGMTTHEIKSLLKKSYQDANIYKNPNFNVVVTVAAMREVRVTGFVGRSGPVYYRVEKGITFVEAIIGAGTIQGRGNPRDITLRRQEKRIVNGKEQIVPAEYTISYKRIQNGYDDDFEIAEYDWIIVGEDWF
jgi:protein involved in polysaccharide export with SLBB domain